MDPLERVEEIEGRLSEMAIALGKMAPGSRAIIYLSRELEELLTESREQQERWAAILERGQELAGRMRSEGP